MTRPSVNTLLSLEQYFDIIGINPIHGQTVVCQSFPVRQDVTSVLFKHAWQEFAHAGHEEIAFAISQAEEMISEMLGYFPAPCDVEDELRFVPGQSYVDIVRSLPPYRMPTIKLSHNKFIKGGKVKSDLVESSVAVVRSDADGDSFDELVTLTTAAVVTTGWAEKDIAVYRPGSDIVPEERVRGLRVKFTGGTIVITGNFAQFVDPDLWDYSTGGRAINGDDTSNFLTDVDVYHEYVTDAGNTYAPVVFMAQDILTAAPPSFVGSYGVMQVFDYGRSVVSLFPTVWNATKSSWDYWCQDYSCLGPAPILLKACYRSGVDSDKQGRMKMPYARAVASLATALITKPVTSVGPPENLMEHWQTMPDPAYLNYAQASCPWGNRNGAYEAYSFMLRLADAGSASI